MSFTKDVLRLDPEAETNRICQFIKEQVLRRYRRKGVVVGLSGGVDSALLAALSVRTFGTDHVLGVLLPEKESSPVSELFGKAQADALGVKTERVDLTPILSAMGVYDVKNNVITNLCPDYDPDRDKTKLSLPAGLLERSALSFFSLTVQKPDGSERKYRLAPHDYQNIMAAQNMKQRVRMTQLYHHAERLNYVVGGTTNRIEMDQGWFVKYGDGGVDLEPLAHLYKAQVYQLSRHLGVTADILNRAPTADTWTAEVSDEEFYFRMPLDILDLLLYAWSHGVPKQEIREALGLTDEQIGRAFKDFDSKKRASWHLTVMPPHLPL